MISLITEIRISTPNILKLSGGNTMRVAYRALVIAALLMSSSVCVLANSIQWTFNQASFSDGNVVTGSFITNSAVTAYLSFSITVSNAGTPADSPTVTDVT